MIKRIIRLILPYASAAIPYSLVKKIAPVNLIIPYYHVVSDRRIPHIINLFSYKNRQQFRNDLDFLVANYKPISLDEVINRSNSDQVYSDQRLLLTFDDGYREIYEVVAPILKEKGIPAVFFLTPSLLDNRNLFWANRTSLLIEAYSNLGRSGRAKASKRIRDIMTIHGIKFRGFNENINPMTYLEQHIVEEIANLLNVDFDAYLAENKPYLTSDQVTELIKDGFSVGAHSLDHPLSFGSLDIGEQVRQTTESVRTIREQFALDYGAFSFPVSDNGVTEKYFQTVNSDGRVDITFGTAGLRQDSVSNNLQRCRMEGLSLTASNMLALHYAAKLLRTAMGADRIDRTSKDGNQEIYSN